MSRSNLGRGSQSYLKKSASASSPFRGNEFYPYSHVFKQIKSDTFLKLIFCCLEFQDACLTMIVIDRVLRLCEQGK